jgi:hypothetical protein
MRARAAPAQLALDSSAASLGVLVFRPWAIDLMRIRLDSGEPTPGAPADAYDRVVADLHLTERQVGGLGGGPADQDRCLRRVHRLSAACWTRHDSTRHASPDCCRRRPFRSQKLQRPQQAAFLALRRWWERNLAQINARRRELALEALKAPEDVALQSEVADDLEQAARM